MQHSADRILTTHVGSLPRPARMTELSSWSSGPPKDPVLYATLVREAVAQVVREQAAVGLDIINDGEFGKAGWAGYIVERLGGIEVRPDQRLPVEWLGLDRDRFRAFVDETMPAVVEGMAAEACVDRITYDPAAIRRNIADLKAALEGVTITEAFLTAVAPASASFASVDEYYGNEEEFMFALAAALGEEYRAIHEAGLLVQVDDAVLANMYETLVRQSPARYRDWAELRIEALNRALEGIPADRVRYHVCFGSWHAPHVSDAPLEALVDLILKVNAGAYSIEAANPRHEHEWRVWESARLPDDRILIPGVITHHLVTVEHPRVVADRILRYARIVGRERVIAGTDCGFAQIDTLQRVHPSIMWAKFEALVEGARIASRELWSR